jgi:hypothetical protein
MQHKIVTQTLIFTHGKFWPYTANIRCPRYAKLFTACLSFKIKIKIAIKIKILLVGPISAIFGGVGVFHVVRWCWCVC